MEIAMIFTTENDETDQQVDQLLPGSVIGSTQGFDPCSPSSSLGQVILTDPHNTPATA